MKRFLAILLVSLMSLSILAGCDRPVNKEVNDGKEQLTTTAASAKPTTKTEKKTTKASATNKIFSTPSTQDLVKGYFHVIGTIPKGTAGASLKLAKAVAEVYRFCAGHPFWAMDTEAYALNLVAAQEGLSEEEKAVFTQNRGALTEEAVRLLDETEELGSAYADAGVEELMDELRNDPSVRLSVETFIFAVETLNEQP